jgi:hypothetical protein
MTVLGFKSVFLIFWVEDLTTYFGYEEDSIYTKSKE